MIITGLKLKKIFRANKTPKWNVDALRHGKARELREAVSKELESRKRGVTVDKEWVIMKNSESEC